MKYDCHESELETALRLKNQHFESLTEARQEIERLRAENLTLHGDKLVACAALAKARAALETMLHLITVNIAHDDAGDCEWPIGIDDFLLVEDARQALKEIE